MKTEILAPAGGPESVRAAVLAGADAVYLGYGEFNARRNAAGFSEEELTECVRFCHERDCRVYLTLNTLVFDDELESCIDTVRIACRIGIDALIVQDLGVAEIVRRTAPLMPLHASTQMSVHTLEGVLALKEKGFTRVVLARELSRKQIAEICARSGVEIEVFVHGALCMSVSGQCYLSAMIGSRSGNRGLCAQPCRLPFAADPASEGKEAADLSLKDSSLIPKLRELQEMGVASAKIEGRMKRPEYVAAAVSACRKALDGGVSREDMSDLEKVFSRSGFTDGYYAGHPGKEMFGIRRREDVTAAKDVLKDFALLYKDELPRVPVDMAFSAKRGEKISLTVKDRDGHTVKAEGDLPADASKKAADRESVLRNLEKTGGTPYYPARTDTEIGEGLFLPASSLNALRRECLAGLSGQRRALHPVPFSGDFPLAFPKLMNIKIPFLRARFESPSQIPAGAVRALEEILLPISEWEKAKELPASVKKKLILELPRGMFDGTEHLRRQMEKAVSQGIRDFYVQNIGQIPMVKAAGGIMHGGFGLNITNSVSLEELAKADFKDAALSLELTMQRAKSMADYLPCGIIAYGYLPLMLLRNCPVKAAVGCAACGRNFTPLTDRMGNKFPVICHDGCSELLNCKALYLADTPEELNGFSFLELRFNMESREDCEKIIGYYSGERTAPHLGDAVTRGLTRRGVL